MIKPELLCPAGNLEKLKIAMLYGADACYVGGTVFGLRKYADNFSLLDLEEAISFANTLDKKVYVVLNGFAHNEDLDALIPHLCDLERLQPHGLIISDLGIFHLAKEHTTIPLHVSTQASITNKYTVQFWIDQGAKRVILARETSVSDTQCILEHCDTEVEVFVHGAMCASYSGKCVISNYTSGRDSNRGGCVQSCRHTFDLFNKDTQEQEESAHIMNAKDLMGIIQLPQVIQAGIHSLKIEGRMKSNLYVANVASSYRQAIDICYEALQNGTTFDPSPYINTLNEVSNRTFSTGGLEDRPAGDSINYHFEDYAKTHNYIGVIKSVANNEAYLEVKSPFKQRETLEILSFNGSRTLWPITSLTSMIHTPLEHATQNTVVRIPLTESQLSSIAPFQVVRQAIA